MKIEVLQERLCAWWFMVTKRKYLTSITVLAPWEICNERNDWVFRIDMLHHRSSWKDQARNEALGDYGREAYE
jgi:hypothetical protein